MFKLVSSRSRDAIRRALPPETGPTRPVVRTRQIATLPGPWEPPINNSLLLGVGLVGCGDVGGERGRAGGEVCRVAAASERAATATCAGCGGPGAGARRDPLGCRHDRGGGVDGVAWRTGAGIGGGAVGPCPDGGSGPQAAAG